MQLRAVAPGLRAVRPLTSKNSEQSQAICYGKFFVIRQNPNAPTSNQVAETAVTYVPLE
jgi:hypothetical protein